MERQATEPQQPSAATLDHMPAVLVPIDEIRATPGEQPWQTALTFRGGMMHAKTKTIPMLSGMEGPSGRGLVRRAVVQPSFDVIGDALLVPTCKGRR